jgi:glycosyltransferase involved in cell wall biosynthesis
LQDRYGPAASQVLRVYNGLDLAQFTYAAPVGRPQRTIAVGRLVEKKGFADLVTACAILRDRDLVVPCDIIGAGPLQAELQAQIERLGLLGQVVLRGPQPQYQVMAAVQKAAAFVAPCVIALDGNRDGLPTVLLEAMALGTPVVSTDVTGISEVVRHEQTGLLVGQHDPGTLANAIARLLADEQLRQLLAQRARALIEAEFNVHDNIGQLLEVFAAASAQRRKESLQKKGALRLRKFASRSTST